MARHGWKWLKIAENAVNVYKKKKKTNSGTRLKWLDMAKNGWKWLHMTVNGF